MKYLNPSKLQALLTTRLEADLQSCRVSGAHLLVCQEGKTAADICRGLKNPITGEPLQRDAMYRLASMTKPVTGVAAVIAQDLGYFSLDDKLEDHMPEFSGMRIGKLKESGVVAGEPAQTPLRIWHLLAHCNGVMAESEIGNHLVEDTPRWAYQSLETMTRYCATTPLCFEPTSRSAYTGRVSFDIVAHLIERKSGMTYAAFLDTYLFQPMGLQDFTYNPTEAQWQRMLMLTDRTEGGNLVAVDMGRHIFEGMPLSYTCAGAGLAASMSDYNVFAQLLLNDGVHRGRRLISHEGMAALSRAYIPADAPGRDPVSSWGLGVRVTDREWILPIGSFGWSGAYGTHFWVDPVNKITAIYLRGSRFYDSHGCGTIGVQFEKDVMACLEPI